MKTIELIYIGAVIVLLSACSGGGGGGGSPIVNDQPDVVISSVPNNLQFEASVSASRGASLNEAVSLLHTVRIEDPQASSRIMKLMKLKDTEPSTLQAWLEERVHYVANDDFDLENKITVEPQVVPYPDPNIFPDALSSPITKSLSVESSGSQVVMSNMGAAIYYYGKKNEKLIKLDLGRIGIIPINSPRVGFLEIGPGMFPDLGGQQVQNILLGIFRTATLFHEARHSDGHAKTLAFMHAKCPYGHDYAGRSACDAAANGPYTIDAVIHKSLMSSCGARCTEKTMKVLQALYLDIADRTLTSADLPHASPEAKPGTVWDDKPESIGVEN